MEFAIGEKVVAALRSTLTLPNIDVELRDSITALLDTSAASVPLTLLRRVAAAHRTADRAEYRWVHDICRGTSIYLPSPEQPKRSKEFELYINKLKIKQENEVYDRMVAKSDCSILGANSIRNESADIREQFSIGSNVIAAMATGFVACYFVGKSIFWDNPAMAYVSGLVGVIAAMAIEMVLFIARSEREEIMKKNPPKQEQRVFKSKPIPIRPSVSAPAASKAADPDTPLDQKKSQ